MTVVTSLNAVLNKTERQLISGLDSPKKIQDFLDSIPYSSEPIYRCPLRVLRDRIAH